MTSRGEDACAQSTDHVGRIRALNDQFRTSLTGGTIVVTPGIQELGKDRIAWLLRRIVQFDAFDRRNDPFAEHDFGAIPLGTGSEQAFWKIDYYDKAVEFGSPDPADSSVTHRVMTLMLASEY